MNLTRTFFNWSLLQCLSPVKQQQQAPCLYPSQRLLTTVAIYFTFRWVTFCLSYAVKYLARCQWSWSLIALLYCTEATGGPLCNSQKDRSVAFSLFFATAIWLLLSKWHIGMRLVLLLTWLHTQEKMLLGLLTIQSASIHTSGPFQWALAQVIWIL